MIEIINLTKKFGKFTAVDNLSLSIGKGELFGFLGPNGAGKTTTIKMLTGLMIPTNGTAAISGYDIQKQSSQAKQIIGFIPDRPYVYEKLTGGEFLEFIARLYKIDTAVFQKKIDEFMELFELSQWKNELIESYSHGMKQKLVMSAALIHSPSILIIDEPMVGLDPKSARLVKEIFKNLAGKGITVLISTHSMELVEKICTRIGIIHHGRLIALGSMEELKKQAKSKASHLEDIFLELTGVPDLEEVVKYI